MSISNIIYNNSSPIIISEENTNNNNSLIENTKYDTFNSVCFLSSETNTSDINIITNDIKNYSHDDKKNLLNRINNIKNKKCYLKIFSTIHNKDFKYTKNDNGIFFNLTILPNNILSIIENIIVYYENKIKN